MVGFELAEIPAAWLDGLAPGGAIVAPVRGQLVIATAEGIRPLGPVRYVRDRSERGKVEMGEPLLVAGAEAGGPGT